MAEEYSIRSPSFSDAMVRFPLPQLWANYAEMRVVGNVALLKRSIVSFNDTLLHLIEIDEEDVGQLLSHQCLCNKRNPDNTPEHDGNIPAESCRYGTVRMSATDLQILDCNQRNA